MDKEIKEIGKKTEEGRLKIREIRKGEFGIGALTVIKVVMALCGIACTAEGVYAINRFLEGYATKYGTVSDIFAGVFPFVAAYLCYSGYKRIENDQQNYRNDIVEIEDEIRTL